MELPEKYAKWKGVLREEINWHPTIDDDKCIGCGMCITSCGRDVFDFYQEKNISIVARPLQCMVGCTSCEAWCIVDAISFPDKQYVRDLIKQKNILSITKKQLDQKINQKK